MIRSDSRPIGLPLLFLAGCLVGLFPAASRAEPQPGDVFREYVWTNQDGDAGGSLRVGGRVGYGGGAIPLAHDFDLEHAERLEVVIEKLLCHDGTRGLAISLNDQDWIPLPEPAGIPQPQWEYQHHVYPIASIPLDQLHSGTGNQFRLRVSDEHPWRWPQHLIYGVHFRVYYDADRKPHPSGRIVVPSGGTAVGREQILRAEAASPNSTVARVEFLGRFEDVNLEGDGHYTQWHYHYVRSKFSGHLGTADAAPWQMAWDTSWVPDQPEPFQLAARVTDATGLTVFTDAVKDLTLDRGGFSVELCKPYGVPKKWVTRSGEREQRFRVSGDLSRAVAAKLVWCSWSPGYMEGVYLNDHKVFDREGPRYASFVHRVPLEDLSVLRPGENVLRTGKTPKYDGKMVHGMEVNWPGIMLLIQYESVAAILP